jgi:hypothetical protein
LPLEAVEDRWVMEFVFSGGVFYTTWESTLMIGRSKVSCGSKAWLVEATIGDFRQLEADWESASDLNGYMLP